MLPQSLHITHLPLLNLSQKIFSAEIKLSKAVQIIKKTPYNILSELLSVE